MSKHQDNWTVIGQEEGFFKRVDITDKDFVVATYINEDEPDPALEALYEMATSGYAVTPWTGKPSPHIPHVFKRDTVDGQARYFIKKYKMPITEADIERRPTLKKFMGWLRRSCERASQDPEVVCGTDEVSQLLDSAKAMHAENRLAFQMKRAVIGLCELCLRSGPRWGLEFQNRNLGLDEMGHLVFVDSVFDMAEVARIRARVDMEGDDI